MSLRDELIEAMAETHSGSATEARQIVDAFRQTLADNGLKIVPVDPTLRMQAAGAFKEQKPKESKSFTVYKAMLEAAPNYLEDKANDLEPLPQPPHSEE